LRLNLAPGLAYYAIDEKTQQLWGELGYDLQRDIRSREAVDAAAAEGKAIEKTETRHNARAFVGYTNSVNEHVSFNTGLEFLLALSPFKDDVTDRANWRLGWDAGVTDKVSDKFSLASTISIRYDNNPLPGIQHTDALMAMNLVYTLL
jgi:putative salt-induced outer membrane protein